MNTIHRFILAGAVFASAGAFAANAQIDADKQAVEQSCAAEATTAQCGDAKVGTGLLKCISAHKKAHKDFKASPECNSAIKKYSQDVKALKAQNDAKKAEAAAKKDENAAKLDAKQQAKQEEKAAKQEAKAAKQEAKAAKQEAAKAVVPPGTK